jgi:uncharacterized Zn finger protein
MKAKNEPRFDVEVLRELAGAKVFARGEAYYRGGQVEILVIEPGRVLAQVAGTEDYRAELTGHGEDFDGECSCPAFEDWGFCKHLVATALAANDLRGDEAGNSGALGRIRDNLKEKEIDSATRTRDFVEYREASGWVAHVDSVLDTVAGLASGARAGLARELAARAIDRIEQAIENIDDSDGHCGVLLGRARDIHLAAIHEVRPDAIRLARDLFVREMQDEYGTFEGAVALYADALGETGLAEYHRLAAEAWEKLPTYTGRRVEQEQAQREFLGNAGQLMRILDFFAERAGEVDTRIALRTKDLSSQWGYLQLAEFCLSQGRTEEALQRAEEGLWVFEDQRPDERLVLFAVDLLSKTGRKGDAETHLWRAFEKAPTLELYRRLRKLGGEIARERAVKFLEAKEESGERMHWHNSADLLIRIWMQEKMFDAAWAAVRKQGSSVALKEEIARASEATHPREALEVYVARVDQLANAGGASAYAEAVKLVARMAKLRTKGEQTGYVLALRERFGRKRNFMKLLG